VELILLNLVLAIISSFVAAYLVLTRKYLRARVIACILLGGSIWSYGYAMEMYFTVVEIKYIWANIQFLGMAVTNIIPVFVALFFDKDEWLTKRNVALGLAVPSLFLGLVATNGLHGAVITSYSLNFLELNYPLIKTYGRVAYGFLHYSYVFVGLSLLYGVSKAHSHSEENWKKVVMLMGMLAIPIVCNIRYMHFTRGVTLDYTSIWFNVLGVALALFIPSNMRPGTLFPLEYSTIIGSMRDIVLITNSSNRISFVNPAAKNQISRELNIHRDNIVGKKISQILDVPVPSDKEFMYNGTKYDISSFTLPDWRGRPRSTCYILRDISDRVKLERKLETLHMYAAHISNAQTMEEIGGITSNALSMSLGFDSGFLYMVNDFNVSFVKSWGIKPERFQRFIEVDDVVENMVNITESKIYASVDDFLVEVGFGISENYGDKTLAMVPIVVEGEVKGILALFQNNIRKFSDADVNMLEIFGNHLESAILSFKQREALKEAQAEEIRKILEGAGRVSSMVRHDLRGPLQTIRNASHILSKKPENIDKMEPIINRSIDYMVKILEDLEYQDQPSNYEKVRLNLNTVIDQVLTHLIVPENITIEKNLCPTPRDHMIDKVKIQRMLDNLFRNAFDAMSEGGTLTISTKKCTHGTEINVKDTGIGVEDLSKLFKPFHTTKANGMGLGLVSVKQTVEKHGGDISVQSEPGVGTEFTIRIPEDPGYMGMSDTRLNSIMTT
jgi:signal transduction histidine kinase